MSWTAPNRGTFTYSASKAFSKSPAEYIEWLRNSADDESSEAMCLGLYFDEMLFGGNSVKVLPENRPDRLTAKRKKEIVKKLGHDKYLFQDRVTHLPERAKEVMESGIIPKGEYQTYRHREINGVQCSGHLDIEPYDEPDTVYDLKCPKQGITRFQESMSRTLKWLDLTKPDTSYEHGLIVQASLYTRLTGRSRFGWILVELDSPRQKVLYLKPESLDRCHAYTDMLLEEFRYCLTQEALGASLEEAWPAEGRWVPNEV